MIDDPGDGVGEAGPMVSGGSPDEERDLFVCGYYGFHFDLYAPIGEQVKVLRQRLKDLRCAFGIEEIRRHRGQYRKYLRILDAKAYGATGRQIGEVFGLEYKDVPEKVAAARLVQKSFMRVILSP